MMLLSVSRPSGGLGGFGGGAPRPGTPLTVYQSAGSKWYANLPLQHGPTRATVAFQNGSLERPIQVQWVPLDLSTYTNSSFRIRVSDHLKLTLHKGSGGIVSAQKHYEEAYAKNGLI